MVEGILKARFSKCGPGTRSISILWKLIRNADLQALSKTLNFDKIPAVTACTVESEKHCCIGFLLMF